MSYGGLIESEVKALLRSKKTIMRNPRQPRQVQTMRMVVNSEEWVEKALEIVEEKNVVTE